MPTAPRPRHRLQFTLAASTAAALVATAHAQSVQRLWETNCASCHGDRGQGGGAGTQSLLVDKYLGPDANRFDRAFFDAIRDGVKDDEGNAAGMEAFGGTKGTLNDAQIWGLVAHIRELQHRDYRRRVKPVGTEAAAKDGVHNSQHHAYRIVDVVDGLRTPWGIDFLPVPPAAADAKPGAAVAAPMLITERDGRLRLFENGKLSPPIKGLPDIAASGQGGLMDVAVHPDYSTPGAPGNGWIYLTYSEPSSADGVVGAESGNRAMTVLARGKLSREGGAPAWTQHAVLWRAKGEHYLSGGLHFGSRIVFDQPIADGPDKGKRPVFFPIGERGRMEMAQDLKRPNGKVHRVLDDGSTPRDNPFLSTDGAYPSIWSYGHRNPQGLVMDLAGNLWDTEHGPRGGDELNLVRKGRNFGWPVVSFGINYNAAPFRTPWPDTAGQAAGTLDIAMPTFVWLPSTGVCGLDVVRPGPLGEAFPKWKGDLVAGGLAGQVVDRFRLAKLDANATGNSAAAPAVLGDTSGYAVVEREEIVLGMGRVRDVVTGPDGAIYVVLNDPDKVVRLTPAN